MKVVLAPVAERDIERLMDFLDVKSARAAAKLGVAFERTFQMMSDHPRIGRATLDGSARLLVTRYSRKSSYIVRYRVLDAYILVTRIWHSKEGRPVE